MIEYLAIFIGGGVIGLFMARSFHKSSYSADLYVSRSMFMDEKKRVSELNEEKVRLSSEIAKNTETIANYEMKLEEEKKNIEKQYKQMKNEFENLANQILDKKSEKFIELNKAKLDEVLNPLGEKIEQFEKSVQDKYEKELKGRSSLEEQIKLLSDLNQQISQETVNLTKALKGDSKTRGDWGEVQLEVLLEKSGLEKDVNFQMRPTYNDQDGKRKQPDCIVYLPDEKNIIIDSKVSLVDYEKFVNSDEDDERKKYLKSHVESVKNHVKELSEKDYQELHDINAPDFVFMFVPIEPAFYSALKSDPEIHFYALEKKIIIVSVTNLISAMKTISFIWQQKNQTKNVLEIARQSGSLYDKFCNFVKDLEDVGRHINQTNSKYEDALNKLSTGKDNLIRKTERIRELGAKTKKSLPKELVDKSENNLLEEILSEDEDN